MERISESFTPTLADAARALIEIDKACQMSSLRDELRYVSRLWHKAEVEGDRTWKYGAYRFSSEHQLADTLNDMTGAGEASCLAAVKTAKGDDWPSLAIAEIVHFARRLKSKREFEEARIADEQNERIQPTDEAPALTVVKLPTKRRVIV